MSEYQYYEFRAVDRPLDERELRVLRSLSTRAEISPTSFVNTYNWGDFQGDPGTLMEKCFDAFCLPAHIAAKIDVFYDPFHPGLRFVTDFDIDGVVEFGFDCCSALAVVRHDHPYGHQCASRQHQLRHLELV